MEILLSGNVTPRQRPQAQAGEGRHHGGRRQEDHLVPRGRGGGAAPAGVPGAAVGIVAGAGGGAEAAGDRGLRGGGAVGSGTGSQGFHLDFWRGWAISPAGGTRWRSGK